MKARPESAWCSKWMSLRSWIRTGFPIVLAAYEPFSTHHHEHQLDGELFLGLRRDADLARLHGVADEDVVLAEDLRLLTDEAPRKPRCLRDRIGVRSDLERIEKNPGGILPPGFYVPILEQRDDRSFDLLVVERVLDLRLRFLTGGVEFVLLDLLDGVGHEVPYTNPAVISGSDSWRSSGNNSSARCSSPHARLGYGTVSIV